VTGLFFVALLFLKSPILLRQGAERSTSHDAPIIGVTDSEYIECFFPGLGIHLLLHFLSYCDFHRALTNTTSCSEMKWTKMNRSWFT